MREWKQIDEFPLYEISNDGQVRKIKNNKLMKQFFRTKVLYVALRNEFNLQQQVSVTHLVGRYFVNNPNNYKRIKYIDGNKCNNHYSNLQYITKSPKKRRNKNVIITKYKVIINLN